MCQFSTIVIDSAHTVPQRALGCRPGLGGISQLHVKSNCGKYINIFIRRTISNQHDIIKTAVANISKCKQTCHTKMSSKHSLNKVRRHHETIDHSVKNGGTQSISEILHIQNWPR